jgi:hypothetical protein
VADLHCLGGPGQSPKASRARRQESPVDLFGPAHENQPAADLPSADAGVDDGVEASAVDVLDLGEVEHNEPRLQLGLAKCPHEPRDCRDAELSRDVHPDRVGAAIRSRAYERRSQRILSLSDRIV